MLSLTIAMGFTAMMAESVSSPVAGPVAVRRYHEIERDLSDALRSESQATSAEAQATAVVRLCSLYAELAVDPRLETSDALKGYKAKLWSRLRRIERGLQQRAAQTAGTPTISAGGARKRPAPPETIRAISAPAPLSPSPSATLSSAPWPSPSQSESYASAESATRVSAQDGASGGAAVNDRGQELIELIQRTISPGSWDVAGGQGSMAYYRPLMALVVRATSEVHEDVGGLLQALRRAGN